MINQHTPAVHSKETVCAATLFSLLEKVWVSETLFLLDKVNKHSHHKKKLLVNHFKNIYVNTSTKPSTTAEMLTFEGMQEVVNGMLVEMKGLLILLCIISIRGLLHQVNGFLLDKNRMSITASPHTHSLSTLSCDSNTWQHNTQSLTKHLSSVRTGCITMSIPLATSLSLPNCLPYLHSCAPRHLDCYRLKTQSV